MNSIAGLIMSVAVLIAVIGIIIFSYMALPIADKFVTTQSVKTCGEISRFTQNLDDTNARAEYPVQDVYETCLTTLEVN